MTELDLRAAPLRSAAHITDIVRLDADARLLSAGGHERTAPDSPAALAELTAWLYAVLHAGNPAVFAPASLLADPEFEERVRAAVPDPGLLVPVQRVAEDGRGGAFAELHRVRLALTADQLVREDGTDLARVSCLRPNLTPGFFMYLHETGAGAAPAGAVTRYYLGGTDPDAALALWARSVERLVAAGLNFRTKILSRRAAYPRNDATVYYVHGDTAAFEGVMAGLLAEEGAAGPASPLCAPHPCGLHTAHEPVDPRPGHQQRSYGEHRCAAIAEAVVRAVRGEADFPRALADAFADANIDPDDVARNRVDPGQTRGVPA